MTPAQEFESSGSVFRCFTRLWNWAWIIVFTGVFPLAILPSATLALSWGGPRAERTAKIALTVWLAALAVFAVFRLVCLAMGKRRAKAKRDR